MKRLAAVWGLTVAVGIAGAVGAVGEDAAPHPTACDFGFLSWDSTPPYFQGKAERLDEPQVLWIETGRYALAVETRRLALPHAGSLARARADVLVSTREAVRALAAGKIELRATVDGEVFTAVGLRETKDSWAFPVRFAETGRWLQHVDLDGLVLRAPDGRELEADAHLEIAAWPDRVTFFAEVKPRGATKDVRVSLVVEVPGMKAVPASAGHTITLLAPNAVEDSGPPPEVTATAPDQSPPVVLARPDLAAWEVKIEGPAWSNASGTYYPAEHLDRLDRWPVTLRNDTDRVREVRLVFTRTTFMPITGLTPMWLDVDGFPTGLPVQISKNWHTLGQLRHAGSWLRASTVVSVPPRSERRLDFALCYARWGGAFAASHAQLSLIGWGHNHFWDEAALGSFGESICFEPGRVQRRCFITDVRPFLVRHRPETKPWAWTANVGGGDFLVYFDAEKSYVPWAHTRTDYRSPGPCLTRTTYAETSADGAIDARMTVSLPRANDHLRVLLHLRYDVRRDASFSRLAFLQLGADFYNGSQPGKLASGNVGGLVEEWTPGQVSQGYERPSVPLAGVQPWISAHDEQLDGANGNGGGARGLIVRSWRAKLGGVDVGPHLSSYRTEDGRTALELAPPPDITALKAGDFVEADLEWCVFPRRAEDYYGPDESFRAMLREDANTWKPVHREAAGNAVAATLTRGALESAWPLRLRVDADQRAAFTLTKYPGLIPITFTGLHQPRGFVVTRNGTSLAPSERGDFWQADFDEITGQWSLTANLTPAEADGELVFAPAAATLKR